MTKQYRIIESADPLEPPTCECGGISFARFETKEQVDRWLNAHAHLETLHSLQDEIVTKLGRSKP
jgi:hypothetical protein